ncbi:MAG: DMT family transporter [Streptosporangiaceae bacterium]
MEPILATSLLIALALSAWLERRRMTGMEWAASVATCAGLGVFLTISQPSGGVAVAAPVPLGLAASVAAVLAAGCAGLAGRLPRERQALLLGIGGGIGAGVTDALTKTVAAQVAAHQAGLLADPQIYLLAVVGVTTYVLQQNGDRAASLAAFLPVFAVLDPIVGSGLGLVIYHERLADSPARMFAEATAAATAAWGIARLARSSATVSAVAGPVLAPPEPPATWPVDLTAADLRPPGAGQPVAPDGPVRQASWPAVRSRLTRSSTGSPGRCW